MKLKKIAKVFCCGRAVCSQTAARCVRDNALYQMLKIMTVCAAIFIGGNVFAAPYVTNVVAKQRYPWNGLVDVKYEIVGLTNEISGYVYGSLKAEDRGAGRVYPASTFVKPLDLSEGEHQATWDMAADFEVVSTNVVFSVSIEKLALYMVVDLSGGPNAISYPVSYLFGEPDGGWSDEYKTTKLVLRLIEPGSFKMNGLYDVTLTEAYYCGIFEVTQKQYELVTGSNPSSFKGDKLPVESVSWNLLRGHPQIYNWPMVKRVDVNSFVGLLQVRTGFKFDLPTEAQWEYACRAGTTTLYSYGDSVNGEYMWYKDNSSNETKEVGTRLSNAWGLYDMHGNVGEWCLDSNDGDGYYWPSGINPEGFSSDSYWYYRYFRGGDWERRANLCVSSKRFYGRAEYQYNSVGYRLVRILLR